MFNFPNNFILFTLECNWNWRH